ncbi:MAG: hypothetical protein ACRD4S_14060 [Candidatus Acidiferrales bacterium]
MGKKIGLMLVLALGLAVLPAVADGINGGNGGNITVNGTYGAALAGFTFPATMFSAPGANFTLTLLDLPTMAPGSEDSTTTMIFTMGSTTITENMAADVIFATMTNGLFDVSFDTGNVFYSWSFDGNPNAASPITLLPGSLFFAQDDTSGDILAAGSVAGSVTATATGVPEAPAGILLIGGLLGLAALGLRKRSCDASAA